MYMYIYMTSRIPESHVKKEHLLLLLSESNQVGNPHQLYCTSDSTITVHLNQMSVVHVPMKRLEVRTVYGQTRRLAQIVSTLIPDTWELGKIRCTLAFPAVVLGIPPLSY